MHAPTIIDTLFSLFERHGEQTYDERLSLTEHMSQSAQLAANAGCNDSVVAAALLHDVGHLVLADRNILNAEQRHRARDLRHETVARQFLAPHFPRSIVEPIALHVEAKRYLCATEPAYFAQLSAASAATLQLQGGPSTDDEVQAFEKLDGHQTATMVRRFDDQAKVVGKAATEVLEYRSLLEGLLNKSDRTIL